MNFSLRRLDPNCPTDAAMLKIAFRWETENVPVWYSDAGRVFGVCSWEEALEQAKRPEQADIAILDDDCKFCGLVTLVLVAPATFEFFIAAPRNSDAELITQAAFAVGKQVLVDDQIAERLMSWVCARHRGALRLNKTCGMIEDGVKMLKGVSHGRILEWKRLVLSRERLQELIYGRQE